MPFIILLFLSGAIIFIYTIAFWGRLKNKRKKRILRIAYLLSFLGLFATLLKFGANRNFFLLSFLMLLSGFIASEITLKNGGDQK